MVLTLIGLVVVEYGSLAVGCMAVNYGPFLLTIVDQMLTLDSFNPRVHAQNTCKSTGFAQIHWIWWHSGILAFLPPATAPPENFTLWRRQTNWPALALLQIESEGEQAAVFSEPITLD